AYFGSDPEDYSTDVLGADAASFIRDSPTDQPLLLDFAPYAPHGPATPSVTYQDAFSDLPPWRPPSYNEKDVSDKPLFIQNTPRLTLKQKQHIDNLRRNQYRTLLSVDDALADIISALSDTGRLSNTLIVLASDNGLEWGE